jgi:hypothetical protein
MSRSNRALKASYSEINRKFFLNELPDNVCVRYAEDDEIDRSEDTKYFGWCNWGTEYNDSRNRFVIVISKVKNPDWLTRTSTLLHEMLHVATECRDDHGPAFERWRQLVSDRGVFKKHALRKDRVLF